MGGGHWAKHRFKIFSQGQHPFTHSLADFGFSHNALPGVTNVEEALDWVIKVLYPLSQSAVATQADLPTDGVITFDGSGLVQSAHPSFAIGDLIYFTTTGTLPSNFLPNTPYRVVDTVGGLLLENYDGTPVAFTPGGSGVHTLHSIDNAFRVVFDDGDGKAAAYRYEQREGDASPAWYKIYDMDWSQDQIITQFQNITQDLYVYKQGKNDTDVLGNPIVGALSGQHIYGGESANTNLVLHANAGDGLGPRTGAVKVDDQFLPTADDLLDIGALLERFKELYLSQKATIDTMEISTGSITDSTGAISFGDEDLTTTGDISSDNVFAGTAVVVGGGLQLSPGQINDLSGNIDFADENIETSGNIKATTFNLQLGGTVAEQLDSDLMIAAASGEIDFNTNALKNISTLTATTVNSGQVNVDDLTIDNGEISSTDDIELTPDIANPNVNVNGNLTVTNDFQVLGAATVDDLKVNGQITSDNPEVVVDPLKTLNAETIVSEQIGTVLDPVQNIVADTLVAPDGATELVQDIVDFPFTATTQDDVPHWDTVTQKFINKQIDFPDHGELAGLADDDHAQYVHIDGRAGGQLINGSDSANVGDLGLQGQDGAPGANNIVVYDPVKPNVDASFSTQWDGLDLGTPTARFRHIHTAGEHFGLRVENVAGLPAALTTNVGRVVFNTLDQTMYVDIGGTWNPIGSSGTKLVTSGVNWYGAEGQGPILSEYNGIPVYVFPDDITNGDRFLRGALLVPGNYSGEEIYLALKHFTESSDNTKSYNLVVTATLVKATEAVDYAANSAQIAGITVVSTTSKALRSTLYQLTTSGEINSVAVSSGDVIFLEIMRNDPSLFTDDVYLLKDLMEIQLA